MKRANRLLPAIGGALAGGVIAVVVASASSGTTSTVTTTVQQPPPAAGLPASVTAGKGLSVNQIYRQASPGVVDIKVTSAAPSGGLGGFGFGGGGGGGTQTGEGAGVVYDTQGDILTDQHVVASAQSVTVTFSDGKKASGRVLGTDSSTDVGVVRVNVPASELHPVPLANSSAAQVGDGVVAIGSPFGLPETVTQGIVSAVNRSIQAPNGYTITGSIQTDAAINPGNSGGPLLDASGHVLGLNDQIDTNSQSGGTAQSAGVGFAVPSNTAAHVAQQIIAGHTVKHAYLGISLDPNSSGGATIRASQNAPGVTPGSPAASAGLQDGDTISAINGKPVGSTEQFIATIDTYSPGDTVTLTVNRGGQTKSIKVDLGTRPATAPTG
jgi:S1-C subfamily serine protease